jgi:predicted CoA-binding protein
MGAQGAIVKKLLIKPDFKIAVINPPAGHLDSLGELPEGTELLADPRAPVDFVHLFVRDKAELDKFAPGAIRLLKEDAVFWISYPKGTSKVKTDLNRDILWKLVGKHGFAGVAMISVDDTWSAMRFRSAAKVGKAKKKSNSGT